MKKVIFLILTLVLCLSLTACGGIEGEKAALLYPDIIGKWGTDPFGEEFVLTLSKDGSCSILGNEGTWTLDDKRANEGWFDLTIATEAMKYYAVLGRAPDGITYLSVFDKKQSITIYESEVFTQGTEYTFAELAIQAVPELIGEWGTTYWNEESILTIKEDGTCTLLRLPGRWCLYSHASTWPDIEIFVKLDNGTQYRLLFTLYDRGYNAASLLIKDIATDTFLIGDPERNEIGFQVANRNQLINPMDFYSILVGEWTEGENKQPFAKFNEDGTCTIRGAAGLWTLDYEAYYNENHGSGWDYIFDAKINGDDYNIYLSDYGEGKYLMCIENYDDGIQILRSEVFKINAG